MSENPFGLTPRETMQYRAKLATKILGVMAGVTSIPKNGYNEENDYYYSTDANTNDMIRDLMVENQIIIQPTVKHYSIREGSKGIMDVMLEMRITDAETGYYEDRPWIASGMAYDEKAIYKAYTGGQKYFIIKSFLASQEELPERAERKQAIDDIPESFKEDLSRAMEAHKAKEAAKVQESGQAGPPPDAIKPDQVGKIKLLISTLASYSGRISRKKAEENVWNSLLCQEPLTAWAKRLAGMRGESVWVTGFMEDEADMAIEILAAWIDTKEQAKQAAAAAEEKQHAAAEEEK